MGYQTTSGKANKSYSNEQVTYADILNHTHQLNLDLITNNFNSMPDFSRITVMQSNQDGYAHDPGTIYKINVPGYFFVSQTRQYFDDQVDMFIKLAQCPEYLYRHSAYAGDYWGFNCPSYVTKRFKYGGWVNGGWYVMNMIPINPGISTYMRWCDATSWNYGKQSCFIPCVGVSKSITEYFTRVARGYWEISSQGQYGLNAIDARSIFAGNWMDSFSNNRLIKQDGKNGYYTFIGKLLCTDGAFSGGYFYLLDPLKRGKDKVYGWQNGTWLLKYVTRAESSNILTSTDSYWTAYKKTVPAWLKERYGSQASYQWIAQQIADKWCIVHASWYSQDAYSKIVYLANFCGDSNLDSPPSGLWQRGPYFANYSRLNINYQPFA